MVRPDPHYSADASRRAPLQVHLLGTVDFESSLLLQDILVRDLASGGDGGRLILCEHPPGVTIGREGSRADLNVEPEELVARRMGIRWVSRGGGTWAHLPGQIVAYVVVPLAVRGLTPGQFRQALFRALQQTAGEQRVAAWKPSGSPGIATRLGQVGFIGTSVRDGVTTFGCILNVSVSHEAAQLVRWSPDERVSSLAAARCRPVDIAGVREALMRRLVQNLGYDSYHLYTGHPLLTRTQQTVYVHN